MAVRRVLDVFQAFPDITLALLLTAALGPGLDTLIIAIVATKIPFGGRIIRAVALQIKEMDYLAAARALGTSDVRIIRFHVAPQCVAAFLILATTHLGVAIIIEAAGLSRCRYRPTHANLGQYAGYAIEQPYTPMVAGNLPGVGHIGGCFGIQPV